MKTKDGIHLKHTRNSQSLDQKVKISFDFFMRLVWSNSRTNLGYIDFKTLFRDDLKRIFKPGKVIPISLPLSRIIFKRYHDSVIDIFLDNKDPVLEFFKETSVSGKMIVMSLDLYDEYKKWCEAQNMKIMSIHNFKKRYFP